MSANYREPQFLLPNCKNLKLPGTGTSVGSGLIEDRHSLYSMDFDGTDYISAPNTFLNSASVCTLSFWMKGTGEVGGGAPWNGIQIQVTASNTSFRTMNGSNVNNFISFSPGTDWHHYVGVYVGGSFSKLYIDGVLKQTLSTGIPATLASTSGDIFKIGYGQNYSVAEIDEVAVWTRALSDGDVADGATATGEIADLYNGGSPSNPMLLSGKPVAYYPLGEQARKPGTAEWRFPNEVLQGQAIDFDGTDYIEIGDTTSLDDGDLSVSLWFNASSVTGGTSLIDNHYVSVAHAGFSIALNTSSRVYIDRNTTATDAKINNVNMGYSLNTWHNLLMTYNDTTKQLKAYLDGDLKTTATGSASSNSASLGARIGRYSATGSGYFNGQISNVVIWNSDQSTNIDNIYNYGAPQTSYTVAPTAWYKLDKTSEYAGLNANWHNALDFDGSSNYLTIPSTNFAGSSGEVSYSFWLNPDTYTHPSSNDYGYILSGVDLAAGGIAMSEGATFAAANGTLSAGMVYYFDGGSVYIATSALTENVWSHVALVFNSGGEIKSYVNGQLDTTLSSITTPYKSTFQNIGKFYNSTHYLNGKFSNFAVFNQAISAEDVKYLYNGGTPQTNISFEPISWWKLDNLTTGIQDSGSASNNGTATGPPTVVTDSVAVDQWNFDNTAQSQTPNWSSALDFDGSNDYISIGSTTLGINTAIAISAWFKTSVNTGYGVIIGEDNAGPKRNWALIRKNDDIFFTIYHDTTGSNKTNITTSTVNISDDKWHHIVGTWDGTTNADSMKVYFDGVEVGQATPSSTGINTEAAEPWIGNSTDNPSGYNNWTGELSNIAVYNTGLDSSAVTTLYNNGQPEATISSSPVSWWKLDNTTTGIQDSVGSNNGTNNGATEIQTNVWTPRLNAESDTLPSTALVSSDLQFNSAYSSFSLDFDGINDSINCGTNEIVTGAFTASMWIKRELTGGDSTQTFFSKADVNGSRTFSCFMTKSTGVLQFYVTNTGSIINNKRIATSDTITDENWHHLVFVNGGDSGLLKIYIDGSEASLTTSGELGTSSLFSSSIPNIIGDTNVGGSNFIGNIDEVSIFNSAFNQAQVSQVYNNGYPADLTSLSPVSWWRLGEDAYFDGTDFIIPNKITGAPNGTSQNMTAADLVADAPGSYAAGLGSSLALDDRVGDAALSTANSLSFNMTPVNRISYAAGYTPAQVDNVYSMAFDGANDYVQTSYTVPAISSYSFSTWFKMAAAPANYSTILADPNSLGQSKTQRAQLGFYQNFFFTVMGNGTSSWYDLSGYNIAAAYDNTWHHLALVINGTSLKLYLDGDLVKTYTSTISAGTAGTQNYVIGRYGDYNGHYFTGSIDELAIFEYALTPRQIKQDIYNGTTSGKTADLNNISNLTAPVAWYRMGD